MASSSGHGYWNSPMRHKSLAKESVPPLNRRKRTSKPKSRSGCFTCKARHLKCDEGKPFCHRCRKDNWDCDGYKEEETPSEKPKLHILAPKRTIDRLRMKPVVSTVLLQHPCHTLFQTEDEHRYFWNFCDRTAMTLSGYFDSAVWSRLVLQLSHREAFIAHAIVAIGALDKTMESNPGAELEGSPDSRQQSQCHHQYALQQYNKALVLMRNTVAMGYLNCIISCVLTTCFESFHGNQESALAQARSGLSLMSEWQDKIKAKEQSGDQMLDPGMEDDLGMIFDRFDRDVWMFSKDTRPIQQQKSMYEDGDIELQHMPTTFTSLKQARKYYDLLGKQTVRWRMIRQTENPLRGQWIPTRVFRKDAIGDPNIQPRFSEEVKFELRKIMAYFDGKRRQWETAFKPTFQYSRTAAGSADFLGANVLALMVTGGYIGLTTGHPESIFDDRLEDFANVVSLAREVLEHPSKIQNTKRSTFSFDCGVVNQLFTVGTRCRDPFIRREAISLLLNYPRREGVWDSAMAAVIATWIMNMEEDGIKGGCIPEWARLRIVSNEFDLSKRQAILQCTKKVPGIEQRVLLPKVKLQW